MKNVPIVLKNGWVVIFLLMLATLVQSESKAKITSITPGSGPYGTKIIIKGEFWTNGVTEVNYEVNVANSCPVLKVGEEKPKAFPGGKTNIKVDKDGKFSVELMANGPEPGGYNIAARFIVKEGKVETFPDCDFKIFSQTTGAKKTPQNVAPPKKPGVKESAACHINNDGEGLVNEYLSEDERSEAPAWLRFPFLSDRIAAASTTISEAYAYKGTKTVELPTLGGKTTVANNINRKGQAVGLSATAGNELHAGLFTGISFAAGATTNELVAKDLGTLGGSYSIANGINGRGKIVGGSTLAGDTKEHAFLYSAGVMTDLGTLGGDNSSAAEINKKGQIVGSSSLASQPGLHAFILSKGVMRDLGTLGGISSVANGINKYGDVVGASQRAGKKPFHAFIVRSAASTTSAPTMTDLGTLGGKNSFAYAINKYGYVVGTAQTRNGKYHAFLFVGGSLIDLNDYIDPASGWVLTSANGINDKGQIDGQGTYKGEKVAFLLTL